MNPRDETLVPVEVELPQWLWAAAEAKGIDPAQVLAGALTKELAPKTCKNI